jgi:KDO2-lipid IV(A) lauroyltransferase
MAKPPKAKTPRWLHQPTYHIVRTGVAAMTILPPSAMLPMMARLGRAYGDSSLNRKRLERAHKNIAAAFPRWSSDEVHACAVRSYEHLFRLAAEVAYAPRLLNDDAWPGRLALGDIGPAVDTLLNVRPTILITGHVGNWELLGYTLALLGFPMHALYRPFDLPQLDRWMRSTRSRRGLVLVDKFGALRQLPELVAGGAPIGMVADQNAGDRGLFVPYFNRLSSTYKSIGLLAMQFNATIICGYARRLESSPAEVRDMQYAIDLVDRFGPEDWSTHPDPLFYLTARYRRAIETMVRRTPHQYLWMHRIWRSRPKHERAHRPFPDALMEKLRLLPWMTASDLDAIRTNSERDARTLAETGQTKLS